MSMYAEHRPTLSLPAHAIAVLDSDLLRRRWLDQCSGRAKKHMIPRLSWIINIAPEVGPDEPLPAEFAFGPAAEPLYQLCPHTNQPIVTNGFVWSYRGDGTDNRMQHFAAGVDLFGGPPLHIDHGMVNMHTYDGVVVLHYFAGRCISVSNPRTTGEPTRSSTT